MNKKIYLDHHSTTPVAPEVLHEMLPYFEKIISRPESETILQQSKQVIASFLGCELDEVFFTSGATESNNLALKFFGSISNKNETLTLPIEHPSLLEPLKYISAVQTVFLKIDSNGLIDLEDFKKKISPQTKFVSIQSVNHEIGTIQPIKAISKICHKYKIPLHSDATQAIGTSRINMTDEGIDSLSLSSHKIYGPKGLGVLVIRKPFLYLFNEIYPFNYSDLDRIPFPLVVGFKGAVQLLLENQNKDISRIAELQNFLFLELKKNIPHFKLNGPETNNSKKRSPNNLNFSVSGFDAEDFILKNPHFALSTGSACASAHHSGSPVLRAIGCSDEEIYGSLRIGLGRSNTKEDIIELVEALKNYLSRKKI